jgi:hypothetical protein
MEETFRLYRPYAFITGHASSILPAAVIEILKIRAKAAPVAYARAPRRCDLERQLQRDKVHTIYE